MATKKRIGIVVSAKGDKTITVVVQIRYQHPKYDKTLIQTNRYMTHDENNECKAGDIVLIQECAPVSKYKKWKLMKVINNL